LLLQDAALYVFHQAGKRGKDIYEGVKTDKKRLKVFEFIPDLFRYSGAADIVISRAGATSIAELAVQGKACVLIPHPGLTGGHQVKNAKHLEDQGATLVLDEQTLLDNPAPLIVAVGQLLGDPLANKRLAENLGKLGKPDAASDLAGLIMEFVG
jgi:UDP-N-acetylglucosamine--N-acetylmuramyl-(pentapeptide) pyrophosphoryl-undecaprenol N-acetylglucosamine transferase